MAIALPIGLYIGHTGRGAGIAVAMSNIGRAMPRSVWPMYRPTGRAMRSDATIATADSETCSHRRSGMPLLPAHGGIGVPGPDLPEEVHRLSPPALVPMGEAALEELQPQVDRVDRMTTARRR